MKSVEVWPLTTKRLISKSSGVGRVRRDLCRSSQPIKRRQHFHAAAAECSFFAAQPVTFEPIPRDRKATVTAVLQRVDVAVSPDASASRPLLPTVVRWAVYVLGITALACYLVVVITSLHNRLGLNHVDGAWLNLAQEERRGLLPPPLAADGYYGGTRYQPLPIAMLAALGSLLGDDIAAGRLINLVSFGAAIAVAAFWMWRARVTPPVIVTLLLLAAATEASWHAMITIRSDALPAALQLAAVGLLALQRGRPTRAALIVSAALAGAAPAIKLTSLWALIAVLLSLAFQRQWREAGVVVRAALVSFGCLFMPFVIASRGYVLTELRAASVSNEDPLWRIDRGLLNLSYYSSRNDVVTIGLLAAAAALVLLALHQRRGNLLHLATALAFAQILIISADRGIGPNQLIDIVLLAVVLVGVEMSRGLRTLTDPTATELVALVAVLVLAVSGILLQWNHGPVVSALRGQEAPDAVRDPLAALVTPGTPLLSEDPGLPAIRGERAVVGDAFMFRRLAAQRPAWSADLIRRVQAHEFGAIVLLKERGRGAYWYASIHFGTSVHSAILENYRLDRILANGQLLYLPKR